MTRDTETLFYNHRMIIDTKVESEPRAWLISKINRISPNGICRVTLTQDTYNQHTDYVEHNESGDIIGMWADYYRSSIAPTPIEPDTQDDSGQTDIIATISCSGKRQIKIGGSEKTLSVVFQDASGNAIDIQSGDWSFTIDGIDASSVLALTDVSEAKIKVKFTGDYTYIKKILTATFTSGDVVASLDIEILPL